jgi:hypothetical protein
MLKFSDNVEGFAKFMEDVDRAATEIGAAE